MATTTYVENGLNTPNGSHLAFSYSFPVLKTEDVKVALNGVTQATTKYAVDNTSNPTRITFNNTSIDSDLQESTGAPKTGVVVRVYRDTDIDSAKAVYAAGSSIRATDLNNNQDQVLYALQEEQNQKGIYEEISLDDSRSIKFGNSDDASIYWDGTGNEMAHQMMITSAGPMKLSTGNNKNVQFSEGGDTVFTVGPTITTYVNVVPNADGTIDLGSSSKEWKDLYVDGTGYIDTISADTATINGNLVVTGTISDSGGNLELADDVNISGHIRLPDDKKLYLGNGDDASIDWDTDGWFDRLEIRSTRSTWSYVPTGENHLFLVNNAGVLGVYETYIQASKDIKPNADGTIDLGASDKEWKDLYVDGTGYIDTVSADVVNSTTATISGTSNVSILSVTNKANIDYVEIDGYKVDTTSGDLHIDAATSNTIVDGNLTVVGSTTLAANSIGTTEIANDAITGAKLANNSISGSHINNNAVNTAEIADDAVTGSKIAHSTITVTNMSANSVDSTQYVDGSIDTVHIADNAVTTSKIADAELTTLAGMQSGTASKLADSTALTSDIADLNQIDGLTKQTTISDSDASFPTSGAVVDYVASQLDPVGGLEVIATDAAFSNTQPASGVVVSIADAGGLVVNGSGVSTTGRTVGGSTVTINNINSQFNSTTIDNGVAMMVSSTGSGQVYNYHKATLREQDILSISSDIQSFGNRYRVGSSNPSSDNDAGDLFFNTATDKLLVRNAANNSWDEAQSVGNFYISTLSPAFDGSTTDFTITNAPTYASQVLLIINGVLQKPNAGTSAPANGFAIDGSTVKLGGAPATGSTYSAVVIGSTVNIGTPSDNTVSAAVLQSGSVITAKLAADAVDGTKIADDAVGAEHIEVLDANLQFVDSAKAQFGTTNNDLEIFHDGSNSYVKHDGGGSLLLIAEGSGEDVYIRANDDIYIQPQTNEDGIKVIGNGAVELYYDNVKKLETDTNGITVTGRVLASGTSNIGYAGLDNVKLSLGTSDDLQIYHDGSGSQINNSTGYLVIQSDDLRLRDKASGHSYLNAVADGAVELYYDNVKKFETYTYGVKTEGHVWLSRDNDKAYFGASSDLEIYHDGTNSWIRNDTGALYLRTAASNSVYILDNNNDTIFYATDDAGVGLCYDNSTKLETLNYGVRVTGQLVMAQDYIKLDDNVELRCGNGDDLKIYHDGSDNFIYRNVANNYNCIIQNDGNNSNRYGFIVRCGANDASGTNYAITITDGDQTLQGYITFSGGTVTYGAFTAHHPCIVPDSENPSDSSNAYPYGTLLETISIEYTQKDGADTERGIRYKVQKTQSANSRKVLGAYGSSMNGGPDGQTNEHQALILGDGHILVNNAGGNIEVGDGICSSATAGIGQKATANPSMIIGIAQEAITFTGSETKLVAVQYGLQQFIPWT